MKQNKNVVRLTENQLKAMVAESVREALNEISWRMADRAYDKAEKDFSDVVDKHMFDTDYINQNKDKIQKRLRQRKTFSKYRDDAFNEKYGMSGNDDYGVPYDYGMSDGTIAMNRHLPNGTERHELLKPKPKFDDYGNKKIGDDYSIKRVHGKETSTTDLTDDEKYYGKEPGYFSTLVGSNQRNKADDGVLDYIDNDTMKKWVKKHIKNESRLHQIVSESIDRVLKNK